MKRKKYWLLSSVHCVVCAVTASAQFTIVPDSTKVTCPAGADGKASVTVTGGTLPYTYAWSPDGQTAASITGLIAGNYSVTITDNAGNDSTVIIPVTQPEQFTDNSTVKNPECTNNGYIAINPGGGTAPYQFLWNTGSVIQGIVDVLPDEYSVIVTDAASCSITFSYTLLEAPCLIDPAPYFTPNGDGNNDTWQIENGQYFENARLIVFDRWGTKVYEHKGAYEPWDGKSYLGVPVPIAAYYYFFYLDKNDTQKKSIHGSVTIIR